MMFEWKVCQIIIVFNCSGKHMSQEDIVQHSSVVQHHYTHPNSKTVFASDAAQGLLNRSRMRSKIENIRYNPQFSNANKALHLLARKPLVIRNITTTPTKYGSSGAFAHPERINTKLVKLQVLYHYRGDQI